MATIKNFEDLEIWKSSRSLTKSVYEDFSTNRDFGFRDQIQRASISIMNNIAEGFWRCSDIEFRQFLKFSRGSTGEVKSMYYIAEDLKYLSADVCCERREKAQGLANGLSAFMDYLQLSSKKK